MAKRSITKRLIINESQIGIYGVNKSKNCEAHSVLHKNMSFNYYY